MRNRAFSFVYRGKADNKRLLPLIFYLTLVSILLYTTFASSNRNNDFK